MVPICFEKTAHKLVIWWGDLSRQLGAICLDRTTRTAHCGKTIGASRDNAVPFVYPGLTQKFGPFHDNP